MEDGVRLSAANKRIDELEREVAALEAAPEKIDLDLLTQRVTALEVKSAIGQGASGKISPASSASQPAGGTLRKGGEVRRPFAVNTKLILPELEPLPRLATPAEAAAFASGKSGRAPQ